ncbi:hypothetical protein M0805_006935 [Coniferiporia weirii]|nr:hypothetical protein M0805_006935 [Coniferiporia weirii]
MAPYLNTVRSFADVTQTEAGIDTVQFLEAAEGVVGIFGLLNARALNVVANDLQTNIGKVRTRYTASQSVSGTLEELVKNEGGKTATEGLLWLCRGLSFMWQALRATQANLQMELSEAFTKAYGETLKAYHNMIVKGIFSAAMYGCPKRDVLYKELKEDKEGGPAATQEELDELLNKWLEALGVLLAGISDFYKAGSYGEILKK